MRIFFILLFSIVLAFGTQIEIHAKKFEANQKERIATFYGNVTLHKGSDFIYAQKAFIYFDKNKKPIKFHLLGSVKFDIKKESKRYKGKAQEIVYLPLQKRYIFIKDVYIEQLPEHRKIYAQKVVLSLADMKVKVEGGKQPVKMIFNVEEK